MISALAPAAVRRVRPRRAGAPDSEPAESTCLLTRRQPIAPPPTYGRWNEAPRGPGAAPDKGS
jgi:hypothetical protein